ncbi:MAG: class I SAM-dependent methyltransferase [Methanocorpusculum sp.]|nr:class I SAM-dependent methyltransferase [Methanocorpusculum sp.]
MIEIDFAKIWDDMIIRSGKQKAKASDGGDNFWKKQENVDRFVDRLMHDDRGRIENQLKSMNIPSGSTVLDIGAGPGTLAVPLSLNGCKVTTVEPSEPMGAAMETYRKKTGAHEISEIRSKWEDVSADIVGKHDYVISSLSLMIGDIKNNLAKMDACADKEVHIFWFLTPPSLSRGNIELWPLLHGEEYCYEPTADILWNVLYQMGIYANLTIEKRKKSQAYPSLESLYSDYWTRMDVTSEKQKEIIRNYLKDKIVKVENGYAVPSSTATVHVWWKKE